MVRDTTDTTTEERPPVADERSPTADEHPPTADERPPPTTDRPPRDDPNTLLNAVVGAAATVLTAPLLPFAAIFGGGVAGYLQRSDLADGAKVGALSGLLAAIPAFFVVWLVVGFFLLGADPLLGLTSVFAFFVFLLVVGYLVGAGALGGALGAYLRQEL